MNYYSTSLSQKPQKYIKRPTQEQKILNLLRERGSQGAKVYEFMMPQPQGLGIAQYNARIYGLREKGHKIINKTPGHFILENKEPYQDEMDLV